jgi:AcrR family transcriptional regulator
VQATARSARDGILATADRLFYHHGIQAVGVQRLLEESDVTRVTFYRHFPSKDDLVLASLDRRGPPRALLALRTGYVFSTGLEKDTGWAEQFLAAHDRIVGQR